MFKYYYTCFTLPDHCIYLLCPEKLNVKALAELYKQRSLESLGKSSKGKAKTSTSQSVPQTMLVNAYMYSSEFCGHRAPRER